MWNFKDSDDDSNNSRRRKSWQGAISWPKTKRKKNLNDNAVYQLSLWLGRKEHQNVAPFFRYLFITIANGLTPAIPYAAGELALALPEPETSITVTRFAIPPFRVGQSILSTADAYWGYRYPVLHASKKFLDGAQPGAIFFYFGLKVIGELARAIEWGNSTGKKVESNAAGIPLIVTFAILGALIWLVSTGIAGQYLKKYPQSKKTFTKALRIFRTIARGLGYTAILDLLPLLLVDTVNLIANVPFFSADSYRIVRTAGMLASSDGAGLLLGGGAAYFDEYNLKNSRALIRYSFLALKAFIFVWMTILNSYKSLSTNYDNSNHANNTISAPPYDRPLALADIFSNVIAIVIPIVTLILYMAYIAFFGYNPPKPEGEAANIGNNDDTENDFSSYDSFESDSDSSDVHSLDYSSSDEGEEQKLRAAQPQINAISDEEDEGSEKIKLLPKVETTWRTRLYKIVGSGEKKEQSKKSDDQSYEVDLADRRVDNDSSCCCM